MAVSGLEPRFELLQAQHLWQPWGPFGVPTYKYGEMGSASLRRSKSWSGFEVHPSVERLQAMEPMLPVGCSDGKRQEGTSKPGQEPAITTMMVHNLPFSTKVSGLVRELRNSGYYGHVDFVYLPINIPSRRNEGYAFINFTSPEVAGRFQQEWHNLDSCFSWKKSRAGLKLKVKPAKVQGIEACEAMTRPRHFQRMRSVYCKPWVPR